MVKTAAPLGILGDGQLALMLGEAAEAQGYDFRAFGEDSQSSFANRFPNKFVLGSNKNADDLLRFAQGCSAITLENEFFSLESLEKLEKNSRVPVVPSPASYQFFESKVSQRTLYDSLSIPGPRWTKIDSDSPDEALTQIESLFQYPFVLKKSAGGYDGYGVAMIRSRAEFFEAFKKFKLSPNQKLLVEEKISLVREFAQGALFDGAGGSNFLPLVETIQRNGICELVLSRSNLNPEVLKSVKSTITGYLDRISKKGLKGLFNFEFFLDDQNRVYINEGAPRPHNSQHLSLNASPHSQFELLTSFCMTGALPLHPHQTLSSLAGVMINLLGKSSGTHYSLKLPELPLNLKIFPKMYLKKECRPGRKMGHLNLIDPEEKLNLLELGEQVLKEYQL